MKRYYLLLTAVACLGLLSSCTRSTREVWEDAKTCSRYMGKGFRSLCGQHMDNHEYASYYERWNDEPEFVPLAQGDSSLSTHACAPLSKESPGDPDSPIPGVDQFSTPRGALAKLFNNIHFETDKYAISGSDNLKLIQEISQYLMKHQNLYVFVEGHADERGAAAYNLALGSRRANAVRAQLIQNGVSPDQLFTISYGKERPLVLGHDEQSWQENRRAQFKTYERR